MISLNIISAVFVVTIQFLSGSLKLCAALALVSFFDPLAEEVVVVHSSSSIVVSQVSSSPAFAAFEDFKLESVPVKVEKGIEERGRRLVAGNTKKLLRVIKAFHQAEQVMVAEAPPVVETQTVQSKKILRKDIFISSSSAPNLSRFEQWRAGESSLHGEFALENTNIVDVVRTQISEPIQPKNKALVGELIRRIAEVKQAKGAKVFSKQTVGQTQKPKTRSGNRIIGQLQIVGGLAYAAPSNDLRVFRLFEDKEKENAEISYQDGSFQIGVAERQGHLLAELRDKEGKLIGYGEYGLNQDRVKGGVHIQVAPIVENSHVTLLSSKSFESMKYPVQNSEIFVDKLEEKLLALNSQEFHSQNIANGSSYVLRSEAAGHRSSLTLGVSGEKTAIRMFSESYVLAQLDLAKVSNKKAAIIFGRVIDAKGRPLRGAEVKLMDQSSLHPIYLNKANFPETHLSATSRNGLFAFVNVEPGVQVLRVSYKDSFLPPQVLSVEEGLVSYTEVEAVRPNSSQVVVYDGVSQKRQAAAVQVYGTDHVHNLRGKGFESIEFPGRKGIMFMDVDPGEAYPVFNYSVNRASKTIRLPVVTRVWLEKMVGESDGGVIVGFFNGGEYEVELAAPGYKGDVIYFDSRGRRTQRSSPSGGFILTRPFQGLNTVVIRLPNGQVQTQLCAVDRSSVSIFLAID